MTQKERKQFREILVAFVTVSRHARNFQHPEISAQSLRYDATMAETTAERLLGKKEWGLICQRAFPKPKQ